MFHAPSGFHLRKPGIASGHRGAYFHATKMMLRFHIRQNLRSAFFLLVLLLAAAIPVAIWQANRSGLPDSWRALIERELGNQGIHLKIGAIQYLPLRGITARDVRIFADPDHENELSRIGRILMDFDKAKLARGELRLNRMQLANADVLISADTSDPDSEVLELSAVYGELLMPGGRVLEIRNARGKVGTVEVGINARLLGYRSTGAGGLPDEDATQRGKRRDFVALISRELERWSHPEDAPPRIDIHINGDLNEMSTFASHFEISAPSMAFNHHSVDGIEISGKLLGRVLLLENIRMSDARGYLHARADYDLQTRNGRFDGECSLDLLSLAESWFEFQSPDELLVGGGQSIQASGSYKIPADQVLPEIQATGNFACESVMFRGVVFDRVESLFAIRDGQFFFQNARLQRSDGEASGKALIQWPMVRLALESTLPAPIYRPFFLGQPLERVIDSFHVSGESKFHVVLEGGFDATDRFSWAYQGHGKAEQVAYNGVPVQSATTRFSLSHHELDFHNGELYLDTSAYSQRIAYGGPQQTRTTVGAIRYINPKRAIEVHDVKGEFWASPVLAIFNPELADQIEAYQFHRPPILQSSGVIDLDQPSRTRLDIRFETPTPSSTEVLGKKIIFARAKGNISLRGERVLIGPMELTAFDGPIQSSLSHAGGRLTAEITWTRLDLSALANTYGVSMQGSGSTTGRIQFSLTDGKISTLNGEGLAGFENAHLFAVPILGPLSPLIAAIVDDRRTGYERAKDAFLTFDIQDGVIRSNDFRTTTTSLNFTGDGQIDLNDDTVDMTMRVNARGLLGIITLPLRPFYGLFQFRGTGPMREPKWENVMFTNPSPAQREDLLNPPKATIVNEP